MVATGETHKGFAIYVKTCRFDPKCRKCCRQTRDLNAASRVFPSARRYGAPRLCPIEKRIRSSGQPLPFDVVVPPPPSTVIASDRDGPIEAALPERANCSLRNARVQSSSCHPVTEAIVSPMCVASADTAVLKLLLQQNI